MTLMRAVAASRYGDLDQLNVISLPIPEPGRGEVRVRVCASALNPADYKVVAGRMKILHASHFPLVAGFDFSGIVDALGPGVTDRKIGDEVFGFLPYSPTNRRGAFAEMLVSRTDQLALKPAGVPHPVAAASATAGLTAIQSLRDLGRLSGSGSRVLITGVSGGVGLLAVGIARRLGASVTAVGSGRGLELARGQGAEKTIDRKSQDVLSVAGGPFDIVFDPAAVYSWRQWKTHLKPGGTFITTLLTASLFADLLSSPFAASRVRMVMVKSRPDDLRLLGEWLTSGLEVTLDSTIPLQDVVAG